VHAVNEGEFRRASCSCIADVPGEIGGVETVGAVIVGTGRMLRMGSKAKAEYKDYQREQKLGHINNPAISTDGYGDGGKRKSLSCREKPSW